MARDPNPDDRRIGAPVARIDGRAKVTGTARYAADFNLPNLTHAALATSPIARGEILAIDQAAARQVPGVLDIMTFENVGDAIRQPSFFSEGGHAATTLVPLS